MPGSSPSMTNYSLRANTAPHGSCGGGLAAISRISFLTIASAKLSKFAVDGEHQLQIDAVVLGRQSGRKRENC
jgi:hypothetical protein